MATTRPRRLRPASSQDVARIERALAYLIDARELLKVARCPHAVDRVRLAISSTKGALRHGRHRETETAATEPRLPLT